MNTFVLQHVMEYARNRKKEVVIAWLHLVDAFGSVPYAVIRSTLAAASVSVRNIEIVTSLYEGSTVRVQTREGHTDPILMLSGVQQGCPLNRFNLEIDPLVRSPGESRAGFEVADLR